MEHKNHKGKMPMKPMHSRKEMEKNMKEKGHASKKGK